MEKVKHLTTEWAMRIIKTYGTRRLTLNGHFFLRQFYFPLGFHITVECGRASVIHNKKDPLGG